jgi:hypothetical protein
MKCDVKMLGHFAHGYTDFLAMSEVFNNNKFVSGTVHVLSKPFETRQTKQTRH